MSNRHTTRFLEVITNGDLITCKKYFQKYDPFTWPDIRDDFGCNALHLASTTGHNHIVKFLLESTKTTLSIPICSVIDDYDDSGCTPLHRAAGNGHQTVIRTLIEYGASLNLQDKFHGNSALHEAASKGYSFSVIQLIKAGINVMLSNCMGFTALHLCCQNGHNQTCRGLLLSGADPNVQNNYGDTALHTAARYGHAGVMRILISAQCKVSLQNENGDTALHISAAMGRKKLSRILLEANTDKELINKQHETAKDIAVQKHYQEIQGLIDTVVTTRNDQKSNKLPKHKRNLKNVKKHVISPYGCFAHHSFEIDVEPEPNLNSLPKEPLKKGEQYFLDLAGNIHKGPVGLGYQCYCSPIVNHIENKLAKNKKDIKKHLDVQVSNLENRLVHDTAIERARCDQKYKQIEHKLLKIVSNSKRYKKSKLPSSTRSKSLEVFSRGDVPPETNIEQSIAISQSNDSIDQNGDNEVPSEKLFFKSDTLKSAITNTNAATITATPETTKRRSVSEIVAQLQKNRDNSVDGPDSSYTKWRATRDLELESDSSDLSDVKECKNSDQSSQFNIEKEEIGTLEDPEKNFLKIQTSISMNDARSRSSIYDHIRISTSTLFESNNTNTNNNSTNNVNFHSNYHHHQRVNSSEQDNEHEHEHEQDNHDSGYSKGNSPSLSSGHLELFDAKNQQVISRGSSLV